MIKRVCKLLLKYKKFVIAIICVISFVSAIILPSVTASFRPKGNFTVVIDAGHGGRDGGSVGVSGTLEKQLNLQYAKSLKELLDKAGVNVVMTRTNDDGLYDNNAGNKKLSDMRKRRDIINNACPDLVISIHMNSFPLDSCKGAKTFYQIGSGESFNAAKCIQNSLSYYIQNSSKTISSGDYYILNCSNYTSVLIECGFVSSPEEEKLLNDSNYRQEFVYSVYCGILMYLGI